MAATYLSEMATPANITSALQNLTKGSSYDDYLALFLLALGGAGYLSRGSLWDKPDPYHYKWFERPQESALDGIAARKETRNIANKLDETQRDVVIFWGSQSGTAEGFAHRLARDCHRRFKLDAVVADLSDYDHDTITLIPSSKFAIFIMSTYGEGDPSDNSADFFNWARSASEVSLQSLRYAAFGLGNSNYKYYNKVIDVTVEALDKFGATPLMSVGKADDASGMTEEDFLEWKDRLFAMFQSNLALTEYEPEYEPTIKVVEDDSMTSIDLHLGEPVPQRSAKKTIAATSPVCALSIKDSRELFTATVSNRSCIHMDLDLSKHPEIKYKTGDHLALWPINPDQEVNRLLSVLDLVAKRDMPVTILSLDPTNTKVKVPTPSTVQALFQHYLDICATVSRETVLALAQFAPNPDIKTLLQTLGKDKVAYSEFLHSNHVTFGRLLEHTQTSWSSLPISFVIESLAPMTPRYYSISSSSIVSPRTASITAVISNAPLSGNASTTIPGLATTYLSALTPSSTLHSRASSDALTYPLLASGTQVHAQIRKSTFKLPASPLVPLILVAAGTGLAPFRAFLQERARFLSIGRPIGPVLLFFGCRNADEDYLYREEIEALQATGLKEHLDVITAFSRAPGQTKKTYVQDRIGDAENAPRVIELLLEQDAGLYICGSANMARDVAKVLGECLKQRKGWDDAELKGWGEKQKRAKRWQEDVWG